MIIKTKPIIDLKINNVKDLCKLKPLMEGNNLKVNKSQIARDLGVDTRTVEKYLNGFEKSKTRNRKSQLDEFEPLIKELLSSQTQIFYYRRVLYQYLKDNYKLNIPEISFRYYLKKHPEFDSYFFRGKHSNVQNKPVIRFETGKGIQSQLDWKESIPFILKDTKEEIKINILVLILSYSRFRYYGLSIHKTQDILFNHIINAFEAFNGVPHEMLTDNMLTVMDEARTPYFSGKINSKFADFAKQFNFTVKPCIAASPVTKSKVESPMRIIDEIQAYSGTLTYIELSEKIQEINNRINSSINRGTGKIPIKEYQKEKDFLHPLPNERVRNQYKIKTIMTKVSNSSMIIYNNCNYSVPPEYVGKSVSYQVYDSKIHIYFSTKLISMHPISDKKLNYSLEHYEEILKINFSNRDSDEISQMAKKNLKLIGEVYDAK